jgi:hypothetical protein
MSTREQIVRFYAADVAETVVDVGADPEYVRELYGRFGFEWFDAEAADDALQDAGLVPRGTARMFWSWWFAFGRRWINGEWTADGQRFRVDQTEFRGPTHLMAATTGGRSR